MLRTFLSLIADFGFLGGGFFLVGGGEVEIDAAERAVVFGLAEDDGDLFVEGDAVTEMGAATGVGFDRFFHQGEEGGFAVLGGLVEADDELVEGLERFGDFVMKCFDVQIHNFKFTMLTRILPSLFSVWAVRRRARSRPVS